MKKHLTTLTIIDGPRSSGKTMLTKQLAEGRDTVLLTERAFTDSFGFMKINKNTEVIVFDEVPLEAVLAFFKQSIILVNKPYEESIYVDMPDVIAVIKNR